jgi:AcrR family transcriptional regulator
MTKPVKSKRSYDSQRRREQAMETRRDILKAAQVLFEKQGYASTTMAAIAAEAGVAFKTVYVAFETKSSILHAIWDLLLRGAEDAAPVGALPWYREVIEERDPYRQLQLNARNSRMVKQRIAAVAGVIRSAAPSDTDIAALWARIQISFYENQRAIVTTLDAKKALKPELDATRAADILWTLSHPDLWLLLVGERGWTPEAYERWFAEAACTQLLKAREHRD